MFVDKIKEIHVEPTTVCQAECPMCPRTLQGYHLGKVPNKFLTLENFQLKTEAIINKLEKVLFCGVLGEPTACGDLLNIIQWILDNNPTCTIGINSNGGLRDTTWWQNLAHITKHNPYNYVVFSIDGLEDTNHIYRRNVNWNTLMNNAKAYINSGGSAQWDMLVFKHNEHQIDIAKSLASELGFNFFRTKVTSRFSKNDWLQPPTDHIVENISTSFSCMAKDTASLYLSAEGLWYPCCYTHTSKQTEFDIEWGKPIRDISEQSLWISLKLS